ncbi:MAG: ACP S-malonyltransferase [Rickettsiales bacterium]|nr:ACP S-malonyltransferase [Rickettsiales bacterium]
MVKLPVSAPFHSSLMQPAADKMAEALAEVTMNTPSVPLVANVTADVVTDSEEIKALLVKQVTGTVRWRETVIKFGELNVESTAEIGAGKVLTGLGRRIDKSIKGQSIQSVTDLEQFIEALV